MLCSIHSSISSNLLYRLLKDFCRIYKPNLIETWKDIRISKMFLSFYFYRIWIFYLRIYTCFWIISNPFTNEYFIFLCEIIRALTFSHIINPMAFKMVSTSFSENSIAAPFSHEPHSLINISIRINHSSFSVRFTIHPHTIISIA